MENFHKLFLKPVLRIYPRILGKERNMKMFSNYMKQNYDLIPLTSPSANIRPGAIMGGPNSRWSWSKVPTLSEISIFANKVLNYRAGSKFRSNNKRIPANYDIQEKTYKDTYRTVEIPETFNVAVDSNDSSFGAAIKGSFGQVSGAIDAQFEESNIASIKITNSFKVTFSDPDYKDTLAKEITSEMKEDEPTKQKVKRKYLITEVHYASGVDITFTSAKRFRGKADARAELGAAVQVPNAGIECNWANKNVLRLTQKQDLVEKQKVVMKLDRNAQELKDSVRRLSEAQRRESFSQMAAVILEIEADVRQMEEDVFQLLNVQELRDDMNRIKDDIQNIKDSISDLQVHVRRFEEDIPQADAMAMGSGVDEEDGILRMEDIPDVSKEEAEQNLKRGINILKQHVIKLEEDIRKQGDLGLTRIPFAVRGILLKTW